MAQDAKSETPEAEATQACQMIMEKQRRLIEKAHVNLGHPRHDWFTSFLRVPKAQTALLAGAPPRGAVMPRGYQFIKILGADHQGKLVCHGCRCHYLASFCFVLQAFRSSDLRWGGSRWRFGWGHVTRLLT